MILIIKQSVLGSWEIVTAVPSWPAAEAWITDHGTDEVLFVEALKGRTVRRLSTLSIST